MHTVGLGVGKLVGLGLADKGWEQVTVENVVQVYGVGVKGVYIVGGPS